MLVEIRGSKKRGKSRDHLLRKVMGLDQRDTSSATRFFGLVASSSVPRSLCARVVRKQAAYVT